MILSLVAIRLAIKLAISSCFMQECELEYPLQGQLFVNRQQIPYTNF